MFLTLVQKELKLILQSPKFILTFLVCTVLIILSISVGISEYKSSVKQYETVQELERQSLENAKSWSSLNVKPYRKPSPLQIFSSGVNFDVGRFAVISDYQEVGLEHSYYSDDPIFAVFRNIDFTFIITIVLSLIAILYTYNSINGEKEEGTLKLVFSNNVPRVKYILAKITGIWLGLVIPISIVVLLSLILIIMLQVPVTGNDWLLIISYLFMSLLYFTLFIVVGVYFSSRSKKSSTSFLLLLTFWISFVFIIPRVGVMVAGQFIDVPSLSEIESKKASFENSQWEEHFSRTGNLYQERRKEMEGLSDEEKEVYQEEKSYQWMKEDEELRNERKKVIAEFAEKLKMDYDNKKENLEREAMMFSRFSPVSSFNLAAMMICGSDAGIKKEYEDAIKNYKHRFLDFISHKKEESGGTSGIMITMDSEKGFSIKDGRKNSKLDISELPKFTQPQKDLSIIYSSIIPDLGLLAFYILLAFSGAVSSFLKYDVR